MSYLAAKSPSSTIFFSASRVTILIPKLNMLFPCCSGLNGVCVSSCAWLLSLVSLLPYRLEPTRLLCPWGFPGKNTGVACHFLLQKIFLTQGSNSCLLCLLHCRQLSLPLSHQASPNWMVACPQQRYVHALTPEIMNVNLFRKKVFADRIKLRILK